MKQERNVQVQERILWVDYARVLAIFCVVLCHATESYYGPVIRGEHRIVFIPWLVENTLFTLGRLGVPLFLAISGTLLLEKEKNVWSFYRKSLLPLLLTTELWIVINKIFVVLVQDKEFIPLDLLKEMLFLKESDLSHMWYMPMILGIYLFIPFLAKLIQGYEDMRVFMFPGIVVGIVSVVIPTLNVFLSEAIPGVQTLGTRLDLSFGGGVYGLYLIAGYLIGRRQILQKIKTSFLLIMSGILFLLNTMGQYFLYANHYYESNRLLWYTSIAIFVIGLTLFELIRRWQRQIGMILKNKVVFWAKCSFGIYLLHKPIMVLLLTYLPMDHLNVMIKLILLFVLSGGISGLVLLPFYKKWKKMGRILFLVK